MQLVEKHNSLSPMDAFYFFDKLKFNNLWARLSAVTVTFMYQVRCHYLCLGSASDHQATCLLNGVTPNGSYVAEFWTFFNAYHSDGIGIAFNQILQGCVVWKLDEGKGKQNMA